MDDSSSLDGNDIDDETISGENDVEYAEFSMAHRMPSSQSSAPNSLMHGTGGSSGANDTNVLDEDLILLSLFDDSSSTSVSGHRGHHDSTGASSGHSCKLAT